MRAGQLAGVMRRWAALAPAAQSATWGSARRMIDAATQLGEATKGRVHDLIRQYQGRLGGLGDPLSVEMGWLERSYEPAYSRWLAWVLRQLGSAEAVWRVLGLEDAPGEADELRTEAEFPLKSGDRLDIVVKLGAKERVIVETKLGCAQEDDLKYQLGRYRNHIDRWHAKGVLIVLDAERESYEGFAVRQWADICIRLRRELPDFARRKPLVAAMALAFVGAVEQNLLGFPSFEAAESPLLYSRVARHLEMCLKGGS
ncbi:MAG: hypothetical protein ABSE56_01980 [Bryobacteraceae bacterium]